MATGNCPSLDELRAILDAADPVREARLAAHLESCDPCRANLEVLAGEEVVSRSNLRILNVPDSIDGPSLSRIVSQSERPIDAMETRFEPSSPASVQPFLLETSDDPESMGRLGRFQVVRQLGRGGMGVVFLARDPMLGRQVAIKVLNPQFIGDRSAQERFQREARAAATINHANLVTIYSAEMSGPNLLLVMEYVDGYSLQERLRQLGKIALPELLRIGIQVALGLAAAHAHGLVHRDIKPGNILLAQPNNLAKITDFGLAQAIDDPEATASGLILGTPAFMAPEQAQGREVDQRADLFSLGSLFFTMHAGRPPFEGPTMAVIRKVADNPPPSLMEIDPQTPPWLAELVCRLHAYHVEDRLISATDVARILKAHLDALRQGTAVPNASPPPVPAIAPATLEIADPRAETVRSPEQAVSAPPPPPFKPVRLSISNQSMTHTLLASSSPLHAIPPLPPGTPLGAPSGSFSSSSAQAIAAPPVLPPPLLEMAEFAMPASAMPLSSPRQRRKKSSTVILRMLGAVAALLALVAAAVGLMQNNRSALPPGSASFFILAADGKLRTSYNDLAAAVQQAQSGDTLEIRGNSTYRIAPMQIHGKALRIRAAKESHPKFTVSPAAAGAWLETDAPLTLEGLDIVNAKSGTASLPGSLIQVRGASFRAGCCRFVHEGGSPLLIAEGAPSIDVRHCLLIDPHGACLEASGKKSVGQCQLALENSIVAGKGFLLLHQIPSVPLTTNVHLRRNTIVVHEGIRLHGAPENGKFNWLLATHFDTQNDVFDVDQVMLALQFDGVSTDEAQRISKLSRNEADAAGNGAWHKFLAGRVGAGLAGLKKTVTWQTDNDVRSGQAPLAAIVSSEAPGTLNILGAPATWAEWGQLWGTPASSIPLLTNLVDGSGLRKRVDADPKSLPSTDFRRAAIHRPPPAKNGGNEGVAPERVGPGAAYEVWKLTPEYKAWEERDSKVKP
jgi:serine/threonine protein kinase